MENEINESYVSKGGINKKPTIPPPPPPKGQGGKVENHRKSVGSLIVKVIKEITSEELAAVSHPYASEDMVKCFSCMMKHIAEIVEAKFESQGCTNK